MTGFNVAYLLISLELLVGSLNWQRNALGLHLVLSELSTAVNFSQSQREAPGTLGAGTGDMHDDFRKYMVHNNK